MLRNRAGFTLAETIVALVLTAIIGAAVTGVFITHARFFDTQEKQVYARNVSRTAMNLMLTELRGVEQGGGIEDVDVTRIRVRVPYALGIVCHIGGGNLTISRFPTDPGILVNGTAAYSGFAFRLPDSTYHYVTGAPTLGQGTGASDCAANGIGIVNEGSGLGQAVRTTLPSPTPLVGAPVFFYQLITYEFKASTIVPGALGLYRRIHATNQDEEILAPFDSTARFRFYVDDTSPAQSAVPSGPPWDIRGVEITLDGLSERGPDRQSVPLTTSVFFKNRK